MKNPVAKEDNGLMLFDLFFLLLHQAYPEPGMKSATLTHRPSTMFQTVSTAKPRPGAPDHRLWVCVCACVFEFACVRVPDARVCVHGVTHHFLAWRFQVLVPWPS
jgi:hypothetical protein